LELTHRPQLLVFNKIDLLTHLEEEGLRTRIQTSDQVPAVFLSAHRTESLYEIRDALKARLRAGLHRLRVSLAAGDGETMATLYREGEVLGQKPNGSRVEVDVRVPESLKGRLEQKPGIEILAGTWNP